jgi:hypothetical protein
MAPARTPLACVREGDWTLLADADAGRRTLHASTDGELERDLSAARPEVASRLGRLLDGPAA